MSKARQQAEELQKSHYWEYLDEEIQDLIRALCDENDRLEHESEIWEKESLVAIVKERDELKAVNMDHALSLEIIGGTAESNAELKHKLEAAEKVVDEAGILFNSDITDLSLHKYHEITYNYTEALANYKESRE